MTDVPCPATVASAAMPVASAAIPVASAFRRNLALLLLVLLAGCNRQAATDTAQPAARPSILLITLDTTRADSIGPEAKGIDTPAFNALAARGLRFRQAYAAVPETLPSHTSLLSGLYPGGHGIHENARYVPASTPLIADELRKAGYRTSAFVSAFVLASRFGLNRGFDLYDDELPGSKEERPSATTADRAIADLSTASNAPRFVWVHFYDPHAPYEAPEPFRSRYARAPYLAEVAAMDAQIGRVAAAFEQHAPEPHAIVVVGDHGEGLGEHGEQQHGRLLYRGTMHVPLVIVGPGIAPGTTDTPVSARRVFHTVKDWAGLGAEHSLRAPSDEPVLAEAMKPFLEYGWQPQVMTVAGRYKAILAGRLETYDLDADPAEAHDLRSSVPLPPGARKALEEYPVPSPDTARAPVNLDEDAKRRLAALGYVGATSAPAVRKDAPRPADMTRLFADMDAASSLFTAGDYARAVPVLQKILAADPGNLDALLRLATSYSSLKRDQLAVDTFQKALALAPSSRDVRTYLALHYARTAEWPRAVPLLEQVVREDPERQTAVEALGSLKAREGQAAMERGDTPAAIAAFERTRQLQGSTFRNDLDLGVLYLDARRLEDARSALDRALSTKPDDAMALFKRAQVSVLLHEGDAAARIDLARKRADAVTRPLIERERLFR